jgi:hypothetical protein
MLRRIVVTSGPFRSMRVLEMKFLSSQASANLLGYNPMTPTTPGSEAGDSTRIPTAKEILAIGGVWAPISSKKEKLNELRLELQEGQKSLDDAATDEQKLDLYLADGMHEIVKAAEQRATNSEAVMGFVEWLDSKENDLPADLAQVQFELLLTSAASKIDSMFNGIPKDRYLKEVRDFMGERKDDADFEAFLAVAEKGDTMTAFDTCVLRYRFHLIKAAAEHLKASWSKLVAVTNADTDRAAVKGETVQPKASTLSRDALKAVLVEFATGDCSSRFHALWNLVDKDNDGLMDAPEVSDVAYYSVVPVGMALKTFFDEVLDARPVRQPLDVDEENRKKPGLWARRRETSQKKRLKKYMAAAIKYQFEDELEMPHRLRCIYAWANKAHQDNKIENVHIDTGLGGRKRYVELTPKISLPEFREVQQEHFSHLDRIGEEFISSFRDYLLVEQGKGRQRTDLQWNTIYFLALVCVVDAGIYFI